MPRKNKKIRRFRMPFRINIFVILFAVVAIFLLVNWVIYLTSDHMAYYEVVSESDSQNQSNIYTGIAIRSEKITYADSSGYIDYFVRENSRISKNTTLYSIDSTGKFNDILSREETEDATLTEDDILAVLDILKSYDSQFDNMNFSLVYDLESSLKGTLIDAFHISSLEKLAKESGDEFLINNSENAGVVLYRVDNYETLNYKKLTSKDFESALDYTSARFSSGDFVEKKDPIYKVVNDEEWSIAIELTKIEAKKYKDLTGVNIRFLKDNQETTANISVVKGADNGRYGIITLSKYMSRYAADRFLDIQILENDVEGLQVPITSVAFSEYYVIPKSYGWDEGNVENKSVAFRVRDFEDDTQGEFIYPDISYSNKNNYYVNTSLIDSGTVLLAKNEIDTYDVKKTTKLAGVYNINNGYTIFVPIDILDTVGDYYIVEAKNSQELLAYDHIVLNAALVDENQIISQ